MRTALHCTAPHRTEPHCAAGAEPLLTEEIMSKLTIGLIAGAGLAAVAALSPLAVSVADPASTPATVNAAVAAPVHGAAVTVKTVPVRTVTVRTTARTTPAPPLPRVLTVVRSVKLSLPATGKVGANVSGSIQVTDSNGVVASPVPGVEVALQQKAAGQAAWVDVLDDVTNADGQVKVSFTSRANTTWRAVSRPATGAALYSTTVITTSTAVATWAARPDTDVTHGTAAPYSFRISPVTAGTAHLEIAKSSAPTKWTPGQNVVIPSSGVVTRSVVFPSAGSWLVRGATTATASNAAGYTTLLAVTVR
jgi:hypothetical protein